MNERPARNSEDIIRAYHLTMLQARADWSPSENGDLLSMPDGDPQVGSLPYSSLNRLVDLWRFNEPHLHHLHHTVIEMNARYAELHRELDRIGATPRPTISNPWEGFEDFARAVRETTGEEALAHFGSYTYAGCLLIVLSNMLQRFRADLDWPGSWKVTEPIFNSFSVGSIVIAAANGFRHEDEWARTSELDGKQKASFDIITGCLAGRGMTMEPTLARCAEIVLLLSEGEFDTLAKNILQFAHNVALAEDARLKTLPP